MPCMVNTTACADEWKEFSVAMERQGKPVAQLVTDRAPYFFATKMANFNAAEGIEHIKVPAYSQEFNSVVERALGTMLSSTRTCLLHSQAPERAYGECFVALCFALNRILHRSGGRLSRLEKLKGKLLPDQRKHLQPWGCAAYVHLDHGVRGHVGGVGRAPKNPTAAKARLGFLCCYEAHGLGWRICMLPDMRIIETPHVRFEPTHFPCRTELVRDLGAPLLTEQSPLRSTTMMPLTATR